MARGKEWLRQPRRAWAAAAGVKGGAANLTDEDDGSAIVQDASANSKGVRVADVFQTIPDGPIDVLKMDIEGSEYAILADPGLRLSPLAQTACCLNGTRAVRKGKLFAEIGLPVWVSLFGPAGRVITSAGCSTATELDEFVRRRAEPEARLVHGLLSQSRTVEGLA